MATSRSKAASARAAAQGTDVEALRTALNEERRGYVTRGLKDRIAQVDAQLKTLGAPKTTTPEKKDDGGTPPAASVKTTTGRGSAKKQAEEDAGDDESKSGD